MCYCTKEYNKTKCTIDGIIDLSKCNEVSKGAPLVMSAPYFNYGSNLLFEKVQGLKSPDGGEYDTIIDVEPVNI
jgi:hypothetical protein